MASTDRPSPSSQPRRSLRGAANGENLSGAANGEISEATAFQPRSRARSNPRVSIAGREVQKSTAATVATTSVRSSATADASANAVKVQPAENRRKIRAGSATLAKARAPAPSGTGGSRQAERNDEGAPVALGNSRYRPKYYCGRFLGTDPGSEGQCGPKGGPQCPSCQRFQMKKADEAAAPRASESEGGAPGGSSRPASRPRASVRVIRRSVPAISSDETSSAPGSKEVANSTDEKSCEAVPLLASVDASSFAGSREEKDDGPKPRKSIRNVTPPGRPRNNSNAEESLTLSKELGKRSVAKSGAGRMTRKSRSASALLGKQQPSLLDPEAAITADLVKNPSSPLIPRLKMQESGEEQVQPREESLPSDAIPAIAAPVEMSDSGASSPLKCSAKGAGAALEDATPIVAPLPHAASSSSAPSTFHHADAATIVVPKSILCRTWDEHTLYHMHGKMTAGQAHCDERETHVYRANSSMTGMPVFVSCQKGNKGECDPTPNQDNFSISYFKNGYSLACCFDGHGEFGHLVSTRTVQTVPYFLVKSQFFPSDMSAALTEAFELAQRDVVALADEEGWDAQGSGSTAIAAVWNGSKVWTANAGDSRCIIASALSATALFETEDHKPDTPSERVRIEQSGGEVRTMHYDDGVKISRVYVKGEDYPGLCMARSLGDNAVKACGVIATPEISSHDVQLSRNPFLLLASDGVFEFLETDVVVKTIAKKIHEDGSAKRVAKLQREARKRWREEEGSYCDDITSVLIHLRDDEAFRSGQRAVDAVQVGPPSPNVRRRSAPAAKAGLSAEASKTLKRRTSSNVRRVRSGDQKCSSDESSDDREKASPHLGSDILQSLPEKQTKHDAYFDLKKKMETAYVELKARMTEFSKEPSAARKKRMEETCAELKTRMAQLKKDHGVISTVEKDSGLSVGSLSTTSMGSSDDASDTPEVASDGHSV